MNEFCFSFRALIHFEIESAVPIFTDIIQMKYNLFNPFILCITVYYVGPNGVFALAALGAADESAVRQE